MIYYDIFKAFDDRGLDYVVIGGVALVMHGAVRLTADLDLMVALDTENLRKLVEIMGRLKYLPRIPEPAEALLDPVKRQEWRERKHMEVFSFYAPDQPLALIDRHLASGGMGAVFRARHVYMRKDVALKVLRPDLSASAELVERFRREAEIAASLEHDHIVRVTDFGRTREADAGLSGLRFDLKRKPSQVDYFLTRNKLIVTRRYFSMNLPTVYLGLVVTCFNRIWRGQWARLSIIMAAVKDSWQMSDHPRRYFGA